ncbi:MAG TPA: ABC transporter ATP-binding protein, partial [Trebonia sp.]
DLRDAKPGCPFIPRCGFAVDACSQVDMTLLPVLGNPGHLTACPIVTPAARSAAEATEGALS